MQTKEIIIKVQNDRILFNPELFVDIEQTNIPIKSLRFRTNEDIYWKVEMVEYFPDKERLNVKIVDYKATDITHFINQVPKKEIKQLAILGKYDWAKLEPLLVSYTKSHLDKLLYNLKPEPPAPRLKPLLAKIEPIQTYPVLSGQKNQSPERNITLSFRVAFKEAKFSEHCVVFTKHIKDIGKVVTFSIANEHVLAEFDNIKYWFSKKLKTKYFHVSATLTLVANKIKEVKASSTEINLITPELIYSVKYSRTLALIERPKVQNTDKSLFTAETLFSQIDSGDVEGNVFQQSAQDIIVDLINQSSVRNKKELAYLSGNKQSSDHQILFTTHPNFGFIFFIDGKDNSHFVWELLNSHATYIWSFQKSEAAVKLQFDRIEKIVNKVKALNREEYKRSYKTRQIDEDVLFVTINHTDIGCDTLEGFLKWKTKLDELLV